MYNPWDVNNFIAQKQLKYYWSDTGIPSAIREYIENSAVDLETMITALRKNELVVDELELRVQDLKRIKAEILFLNSGYLTIKEVLDEKMYLLDFPNKETEVVMLRYFLDLTTQNSLNLFKWKKVANQIANGVLTQNSEDLEEGVSSLIYDLLGNTAYDWINKNPEGWLKSLMGVALRMSSVYYWAEPQNILGRADLHIPKDGKIYVVEVKVNGSATKAIEQIDQKYTTQYQADYDQVVKVGINWDKKKQEVEVIVNSE